MQDIQAPLPVQQGHSNWMDGVSYYPGNPLVVLRMAAASCFFKEPRYYPEVELEEAVRTVQADQSLEEQVPKELREFLVVPPALYANSAGQGLEHAIDRALDFDCEATLKIACALRNEDHIRVTPQVILVRAAYHRKVSGTGLVSKYAPSILQRADEPATQLAYLRHAFAGKPIPNALRKAWASFFRKQSEYSLAKYQLKDRAVKTCDVVNLARPAATPALDKLMRGQLKVSERTWESVISEEGSNAKSWEKVRDSFLLDPRGHMALLRNLRNLQKFNLVNDKVLFALKAGVKDGKQLPFRYYSAYRAMKSAKEFSATPVLLDTLEECLMLSLGNAPTFGGRVMSLCDNSGSAQDTLTSEMGTMKVSTIANLTGVLTGMLSEEGHLGVFGDTLKTFGVGKNASVFDQLDKAEELAQDIGQSTEHGIWLFLDKALRNKEYWDHVFIYSDMQAGHGGLYGTDASEYADFTWGQSHYIDVHKLVREYHAKVNPNAMFYMVQVAGYTDTLLPEHYERAVILGGWGPGLLHFAHAMGQLWERMEPAKG